MDHPFIFIFMKGVTFFGNVPLYFIYIAVSFPFLKRKDWFSFVGIIVLSGFINELFKHGLALPRPPIDNHKISVVGYGFPSGHAQMAVVVWGWLGYRYKQLATALVVIFLIGFSRIYFGVHYPSQVFGGWFIGFAILGLWIWKIESKRSKASRVEDDYAKVAKRYDNTIEPLVHHIREAVVERIKIKNPIVILDMCCGTGKQLSMISPDIDRRGIDNSPAMLKKALSIGLTGCILGEANDTPFDDDTFDIVLSQFALHEKDFGMIESELGEVKRILKKDGRFMVVDFTHPPKVSLKSFIYKLGIKQIERFAGKKHFAHYKIWMQKGGLIPILEKAGWRLDHSKDFFYGAIQLSEFKI
ncbi:MAG: phosphatase PAP2 family protein [Candidatus Marinimicrobia bacterium]|nr:phosphatase PAP2 family protein [Candidatus Neomarinimicrobiota bacterium]